MSFEMMFAPAVPEPEGLDEAEVSAELMHEEPPEDPNIPTVGSLYIDHRAKITGKNTYDVAIEVVGFVKNEDSEDMVLYRNLKDGSHHVISLRKFIEPVEQRFADGWHVVPNFIRITA